jgi:hypothetical protein
MPRSVTRTVLLPDGLDAQGWDTLVAELEERFGRDGAAESWGGHRRWTHVQVEVQVESASPSPGVRVRFTSLNWDAVVLRVMGGLVLLMGVGILGLGAILDEDLGMADWFLLILGPGQILWSMVTLPRWRRRKTEQLEELVRGRWGSTTAVVEPD